MQPSAAFNLIRDAEIEHTLRSYTDPILHEAGIPPQSVRLFIVNDSRLNAFVAGGLNMFFHTGLITATETPDKLISVIAHETGHLEGAHLTRLSASSENAQIGSVLATVLGAAVGVLGGGEAGVAVGQAGQNTILRSFLGDIRTNEQSADQAALRYLNALGYSAEGMRDMFALLRQNDRTSRNADPYLRTHPLTGERVANVESFLERHPEGRKASEFNEAHSRMRAKLFAFLQTPDETRTQFPQSDDSIAARLARTIADFRTPNVAAALKGIDGLLADRPEDAFFHDLKGQILFEHGRVEESIGSYARAAELHPQSGLLWSDLGRAQLAMDDDALRQQAIKSLERATGLDSTNRITWRQLGIAYGKEGRLPESSLSLAEEASLANDPVTMHRHAKRARDMLEEGTPLYVRADRLVKAAVKMEKEQRENS